MEGKDVPEGCEYNNPLLLLRKFQLLLVKYGLDQPPGEVPELRGLCGRFLPKIVFKVNCVISVE